MATDKELIGVDTACVIIVMFHSLFPQWVDTVLFSDILLKNKDNPLTLQFLTMFSDKFMYSFRFKSIVWEYKWFVQAKVIHVTLVIEQTNETHRFIDPCFHVKW